ncbi:acyl carrier protein [Streptomyces sp. NPDC127117]|uniref:acyl carrier protein n=1 Tax=Streptomyces sp. NPDC127117 TaxID=3345368 RepID=UPI0036342B84
MDKRSELCQAIEVVYGRALKTTDDVFSLGGSSLQAVDLVSRFEAALGFPVDVERLIMAETISALIDELVTNDPEN